MGNELGRKHPFWKELEERVRYSRAVGQMGEQVYILPVLVNTGMRVGGFWETRRRQRLKETNV
jgi:hypothetical protein